MIGTNLIFTNIFHIVPKCPCKGFTNKFIYIQFDMNRPVSPSQTFLWLKI